MNKTFSIILILIAAIFLNNCKKDDTTPPVITLKGKSFIILNLGDSYTDEGATAEDNKDGDVSNKLVASGIPENTFHAGEYIITYNVEDAMGNTAIQASRTVHISTEKLIGEYIVEESNDVDPTTKEYTIKVTQSDTIYNKIFISNFRNLGDTIRIKALINIANKKDTINISPQIIDFSSVTDTITGMGGTYNVNPPKFELSTLKYNMKGIENGISIHKNYTISIKEKTVSGKKN